MRPLDFFVGHNEGEKLKSALALDEGVFKATKTFRLRRITPDPETETSVVHPNFSIYPCLVYCALFCRRASSLIPAFLVVAIPNSIFQAQRLANLSKTFQRPEECTEL